MEKFVCLLFIVSLTISGCEENVIGDFESPELNIQDENTVNKKGIAYSYRAPRWSHKTSEIAPHWFYHWGTDEREEIPSGTEHVAMFWGPASVTEEKVQEMIQLKNEGKLHYILAFNEPDNHDQAFMSVDQAIESWPLIEQVGLPIVSPSVGGPGYNNEWLLEFMERADALNYRVDYIGFHYYPNPNVSKFMDRLRLTYQQFNKRPIWITEFAVADWSAAKDEDNRHSQEVVLEFMKEILPALDGIDWVYRYCWFDDSDSSRPPLASSRLFDEEGNITPLGQFYAQHNPNANIGLGSDTEYTPPPDDNELVFNGHFEGGTYQSYETPDWKIWPAFPNGWQGYNGDAVWTDQTDPVTGFNSGKLRKGSSAFTQIIDVEPGKTYTLKLFSKWQDNTADMKIAIKDNADNKRFFISDNLPKTNDWEESVFEVAIPSKTSELRLILWNSGPVIYLDDISLKPKD